MRERDKEKVDESIAGAIADSITSSGYSKLKRGGWGFGGFCWGSIGVRGLGRGFWGFGVWVVLFFWFVLGGGGGGGGVFSASCGDEKKRKKERKRAELSYHPVSVTVGESTKARRSTKDCAPCSRHH